MCVRFRPVPCRIAGNIQSRRDAIFHVETLFCFRIRRSDLVQFLARFEANGSTRSNAHFAAGPRIPPNPSLAWPHAEDAETTQLNAITCRQRLLQAVKYAVNRRLGLDPGQSGPLYHLVNDVLLNQRRILFFRFYNVIRSESLA